MIFKNLLIEQKGSLQYIIINRESKLNALNNETIHELLFALESAFGNPEVRGLIITGAGKKAFVAGADIAEFNGINADEAAAIAKIGHKVFDKIENGSKPVIAAINGFALGGGLELALACHIRIATQAARLGLPEVSLGLIPGYGGTQRLTKLVGKGKALEIILTADLITAEDAFQFGLVNKVVAPDDLLMYAEELLNKILTRSPKAIEFAINAINAAENQVDGFQNEIKLFASCFATNDAKEGITAFLEKRKPDFKGN